MSKKSSPNYGIIVAVVVAVVVIVLIALMSSGGSDSAEPRVSSEDGSAEAVAYVNALAAGNYADAAQYAQENCSGVDCVFEDMDHAAIAVQLEALCQTNYCGPAESILVEGHPDRKIHTMQAVNDAGEKQRFCLDEACTLQKSKYNLTTVLIDGTWHVADQPPVYAGLPQ